MPGYEVINWYSIVTTAGTPKLVVARLNAETVKAVASDTVRKRYVELGTDPASGTPAQLDAYTRSEIAKWGKVIKLAGMKPE